MEKPSDLEKHIGHLVQNLIDCGIFVRGGNDVEKFTPTAVIEPRTEIANPTLSEIRGTRRRTISFWHAAFRAHLHLKFRSLQWVVERIMEIKRSRSDLIPAAHQLSRAKELILGFQALRPSFPRNYLCMFDSLALLHYLFRHGVSADWIYGVQPNPFEAHCWLQSDSVVLNDLVDHVRKFTPIMAV